MRQVSGVNYKCKVDVGGDQFCHVTVHQPLPHTKEPAKVGKEGKNLCMCVCDYDLINGIELG